MLSVTPQVHYCTQTIVNAEPGQTYAFTARWINDDEVRLVRGDGASKQVIAARDVVNSIYIDDRVKDYIVDVVWATREPAAYNLRLEGLIRYGASPRATIYLALGARAHAFLNGRGYVTPQDVKSIGPDVLRHRIIVSYEAEAEAVTSETIIERIFAGLPVP